ncbi:MAG: hypothetical protein WCI67_09325 [Chloroflexales bacterium]
MDLIIFASIVGVGLIIFLVVLVMLNRAWGDFPGRISGLPPPPPPRPAPPLAATPLAAEMTDITPNGGLVPVNHPLVRRAVMAALERGGSPYALYFIKDGEVIYLVPTRIADPQQREQATRLFASMNASNGDATPPLAEAIRVIQELGKM